VEADVKPPDKATTKPDLGETSSACPSEMGEGGNGPSHCPLPKVVVWSEEESLKLYRSQSNEEYLPIVAPPEDIPFESQKPNMKTNLRVPTKPKHKSSPSVLSPQELQTAYDELLITFSDPLTSVPELQLVNLRRAMRKIRYR